MLTPVAAFPSLYGDAATLGGREGGARAKTGADAAGKRLSDAEQRQVAELQQVDRKVRQHEQMHIAVGGELVISGPSYSYTKGPDGKSYATAGEVGIDTSEGRDAHETVIKARRIRATALAPPDPSPQDRQVAAMAAQMEMRAMQEVARQRQEAGGAARTRGTEAGTGEDSRVRQALAAYAEQQPFGAQEVKGAAGLSLYA